MKKINADADDFEVRQQERDQAYRRRIDNQRRGNKITAEKPLKPAIKPTTRSKQLDWRRIRRISDIETDE